MMVPEVLFRLRSSSRPQVPEIRDTHPLLVRGAVRAFVGCYALLFMACGSVSSEASSGDSRDPSQVVLASDDVAGHFGLACTLAEGATGSAEVRLRSVEDTLSSRSTHDGFRHAWGVIRAATPRSRPALAAQAAAELGVAWNCPAMEALWLALASESSPMTSDGPLRFTGPAGADEMAYSGLLTAFEAVRSAEARGELVYPELCGAVLMEASGVRVADQLDPRIIAGVQAAQAHCRDALGALMLAAPTDSRLCLFDALAENLVQSEGWDELAEMQTAMQRACDP